jgi:hypothetical protein
MSTELNNLVSAIGLDPDAPYSLGNKTYHYDRECNSGHKDLTDDEIAFASETYDGYRWTVPVCKRCIAAEVEKGEYGSNPRIYSYATSFHLKEHKEHAATVENND